MLIRIRSRSLTQAAALLVPVAFTLLFVAGKEAVLRVSGPVFWEGSRAGEEFAVDDPSRRDVAETVDMLRRAGIARFVMTLAVRSDGVLYQRTTELAWPIRNVRRARHFLSLIDESVEGCVKVAETRWTRLCVRK